ncbi:MAG: anti-sigma factor [Actinomycetota bacterium]|nr:anti-sigma factor [Actinomycetota bacterium]
MSTNTHISEELPRLLTGEATRDVVQDAAVHLRTCEDCLHELVSAVVSHAALASAQRFALDLVDAPRLSALTDHAATAMPDLSGVFATARQEAVRGPRLGSRKRLYAGAAVAAALIIGGGTAALIQTSGSTSSRSVALSAFETGSASATATFSGADSVKVAAASLPALDIHHRYEIWLTNDARTKMQPVGWIGTNGRASLTIPHDLMTAFSDIEVSIQAVDAPTYTYSGTSVLRGSYAA